MTDPYERQPEHWDEDLADRAFEKRVAGTLQALGWQYQDNTAAYERPDFYLTLKVRGKQVKAALELKDKRQPYRARWAELAHMPEAELLVLDEVAARTLLAFAPRAFLLFWDRTRADRPYVLYTIIDLFCLPKVRVQRPIARQTERLKAKWLLDARHGHPFSDLNHVFAALSHYLAHGLWTDVRRLEIHGPFIDEQVETL